MNPADKPEPPKRKPPPNPQITVGGTQDGQVMLRIDIRLTVPAALQLAKVLADSAALVANQKRIIVPGRPS